MNSGYVVAIERKTGGHADGLIARRKRTIDGIRTLDFRSGPARTHLILDGTLACPPCPNRLAGR
jgi:hypothetical protein